MNRIPIFITAVLIFIITLPAQGKPDFQASVNFGIFYSSLSQYGEWIDSDFGYGWRPLHVRHGWRPYVHGRWVWTDYGWYWVSNEPFGWATFHYGRWHYDDYYGWIWIPDYDWGPAWVEWCYNDDYIGWAPLSPYATFGINIGISFSNHWVTPFHYWNFVPGRHFMSTRIHNYIQPIESNRRIHGRARGGEMIRYQDNRIYNRGINVDIIERRANTRINRITVVDKNSGEKERHVRDAGGERIEVYRPRIDDKTRIERRHQLDMQRDNKRNVTDQDLTKREGQNTRDRSVDRQDSDTKISNRNTDRNRNDIKGLVPGKRKYEPARPLQRDFSREQQLRNKRQRQEPIERRQDLLREKTRERQTDQDRKIRTPRDDRPKPELRERTGDKPKESQKPGRHPTESRGRRDPRG